MKRPPQEESPQIAIDVAAVLTRMAEAYRVPNAAALADQLGESPSTVSSWKSRNSIPLGQVLAAAHRTGCSLDWLLLDKPASTQSAQSPLQVKRSAQSPIHAVTTTGDGTDLPSHAALARDAPPPWLLAVRPDTTQPGGAAASELPSRALLPATGEGAQSRLVLSLDLGDPQQPTTVSYEVLPRIVDAAAAGRGAPVGTGQKDLIGDMAFSFAWLRQNLGHTSGNVATVSVVGDSMAPTLLDGDTIIVDTDVREVQADAIYVLDLYGARLVKRVRMLRATGGLELISDNSRYQPEVIPRDVARDLVVVGRMVWPRVR